MRLNVDVEAVQELFEVRAARIRVRGHVAEQREHVRPNQSAHQHQDQHHERLAGRGPAWIEVGAACAGNDGHAPRERGDVELGSPYLRDRA